MGAAFGQELARLREQSGRSQEELAEALEVSRQTVYNWGAGAATPSAGNMKRLSDLFHVPMETLLQLKTAQPPQSESPTPAEPPRKRRLTALEKLLIAALVIMLMAVTVLAVLLRQERVENAMPPSVAPTVVPAQIDEAVYAEPDRSFSTEPN